MPSDSRLPIPSGPVTVLWRIMDQPGHDCARLESIGGEWHLTGTAVLLEDDQPCRLSYHVVCDAAWRTLRARVEGWIGAPTVACDIEARDGRWTLNGAEVAALAGCDDVDLNFSPCTNTIPIRRLALEVGAEATVRAAWLRFPAFTLERLDQTYRRTGERAYTYESDGGTFRRELEVNEAGLVTRYPGIWEAVERDG